MFYLKYVDVTQLVETRPDKTVAAGSSPAINTSRRDVGRKTRCLGDRGEYCRNNSLVRFPCRNFWSGGCLRYREIRCSGRGTTTAR